MSEYQVRLGEKVTDKIVNCGAGVYWYIDKLQSEIERLKEENTILKQTMSNNSLLINENAFLKERIDKAIEYIEQHNDYFLLKREVKELLSILKEGEK